MVPFPLLHFAGTPQQIGLQHGTQCKERILKAIEFYKGVFNLSEEKIFEKAAHFKQQIHNFNPQYCAEIDAIAEGANVNPLWIYALNARTEIMQINAQECTSAYFTKPRLLGQTWDWAQDFEELVFIAKITRGDGHTILQLMEPGIIGKIGFNDKGLGVCLNFLRCNKKLDGLPIHVLLRAVLDSHSFQEAMQTIAKNDFGKASNILLADKCGNVESIEFAGDEVYFAHTKNDVFVHTNHYLKTDTYNIRDKLKSSFARFERAGQIIENIHGQTLDEMKQLLLDNEHHELPILRSYTKEDIGMVGTVSAIIMDLEKLQMHITKGNPLENEFVLENLRGE